MDVDQNKLILDNAQVGWWESWILKKDVVSVLDYRSVS